MMTNDFANEKLVRRIKSPNVLTMMLVVICSFRCIQPAFSQEEVTQSISTMFNTYQQQHLQEKLYAHTDKDLYLAGETIWIKLYNVDGYVNKPLNISTVAYVELIDHNNRPVIQAKLALDSGSGSGAIYLPVAFSSGNYILRAYTNWMKNFNAGYFFSKNISVINAQKLPDSIQRKPASHYDVAFFPEGGNLVNGVASRLAFKCSDAYGNGIDAHGKIVVDDKDSIDTFRSSKFGIGQFNFTPQAQHSYKAVVLFPDGSEITKALPQAYDQGFVIQVDKSGDGNYAVSVHTCPGQQADGRSVFLIVQTRGVLKWAGTQLIHEGKAMFTINGDKPGEGISQFTLFNGDQQPICERLVFRYPAHPLQLSIRGNADTYDLRKKVSINVEASGDHTPDSANLSLAVYRIDSIQHSGQCPIEAYLWLNSDLQGSVESPEYYFTNPDGTTEKAIDNLMLTQGWRRFDWKEVLQHKTPVLIFPPEFNGHVITGRITDIRTGLPGKKMEGFISVPGTATEFRNALSDENGRIKFAMKNFYGAPEIIVQTNTRRDSNYRIDLISPFSDKFPQYSRPQFTMPDRFPKELLFFSIGTQVQNIYAGEKIKQFTLPSFDTSGFYAQPDDRYLLDDYTRFTTMEEIIREYVLAVNISRRAGRFHLVVTNKFTHQQFDNDPLILIDGVPVFDVDRFMTTMDPLKLYKLEVVETKYFYGYSGFDGILNFTTYKGDLAGYDLDPQAIALDYEGLQLQRKFYSPQYATPQQFKDHQPDFRTLLYWSPNVRTKTDGKTTESFYTSDIPGRYAAVIQGMDAKGRAGSQVMYFDVKSK